MARLSRLELFQNAVLPNLADGPKSQLQLDVPRYALEALQQEGLIGMRTQKYWSTTGRGGIQMWFLPEHEPAPLRDCALMTFEGLT